MPSHRNHRPWESFLLKKLVEEVAISLGSRHGFQTIEMFLDIPSDQLITGQREWLRRAVENLMLNAADAMPDGGSLVITSAAGPHAIELEIADTGPTLSDQERQEVFEWLPAQERGVMGWGLAAVASDRRIARRTAHGGQLSRRRRGVHPADSLSSSSGGRRLMEQLARAYSQLHDHYRSLTPQARRVVVLAAMVVAVGLGYLGLREPPRPDMDLLHGTQLSAGQLPPMEAAFAKANLTGHEIRGNKIFVHKGQEAAYMKALSEANSLPPQMGIYENLASSEGGPFQTNAQREERMKVAKQNELALAICRMPGIECAKVFYDDAKPNGFQPRVRTAMINVQPAGSELLDKSQIEAIRYQIAGAYAGLKPEDVTVSDLNGRTWYGNHGECVGPTEVRTVLKEPAPKQTASVKESPASADAQDLPPWLAELPWKAIGLGGLAVVGLVILWLIGRPKPSPARPVVQTGVEETQASRVPPPHFRPKTPAPSQAGIELDGPDMRPPVKVLHPEESFSDATPFDFLSGAEDQRLAQLLRGERPPTVALVLSHLPVERAGEVLSRFAPAMQLEVIRRLADLDNADPEAVREVERALESRWSRQFGGCSGPAVGGPDAVAKILAACDSSNRGRILTNLAAHDATLAARFGHHPMAFDDLARCDDDTLLEVLHSAEPELTRAALLGAPSAVLERFLQLLPKKEAKRLRFDLEHPEPIRLSDVEEARRRMAALAEQSTPGPLKKTAA